MNLSNWLTVIIGGLTILLSTLSLILQERREKEMREKRRQQGLAPIRVSRKGMRRK
jgi:hypothetical protein